MSVSARRAKSAQVLMGLVAWAWVGSLLLLPSALKPLCGFICHQRPERSFFVAGEQLPVCARCMGLYVGAAMAAPLVLLLGSRVPDRARSLLAAAATPTAVTWLLELVAGIPFSNAARSLAALPLGFMAAWLTLAVIAED